MSKYSTACFKAYDIRGKVPSELNGEMAYLIGNAFATHLHAKRTAVGFDIRLTSPSLAGDVIRGLNDAGCDAINIGMCGTEEVYHAVFSDPMLDGGVMVTASHNPADYNGMKLVSKGSRPVGAETGLKDIKQRVARGDIYHAESRGSCAEIAKRSGYIAHLLNYISPKNFEGLKIVVNAGHGGAGLIIDELEKALPAKFIKIYNEPDGSFPQGVPNPLLKENQYSTAAAVVRHSADFGVAWDGDFDRCFLFDEEGGFIEGYYVVALLAEAFLSRSENAGEKIIHDPRLIWNTIDVVTARGGEPVVSKTGHAYIKEKMREEDAVYGGEMSAHHYFRDFAYCDSGMIPWLLVADKIGREGGSIRKFVEDYENNYPVSGELNYKVSDTSKLLEHVTRKYKGDSIDTEHLDGLSMQFENWRFNLRASNTEPVVRLNVESRGSKALLTDKKDEITEIINEYN